MGETSNLKEIGSHLKRYGDVLFPAILSISEFAGIPHAGNALSALLKSVSKKTGPPASAIASRRKLTEALRQCKEPIVVVLDDVDRLSSNEIRELFKLVRLTASFPNLIYIVACDRVRVEEALKDSDPWVRGNYLEKIFQWSIDIPTAPRERIRRELLAGIENALGDIAPPFDEKDWPDIEAEIIRPLVRNMRDVRRYSMSVRGAVDSLGTSIALVDTLTLEAMRLFMPRLFGQLPHLIDHLTVPPTWEGNEERMADIISEQMGDTQKSAELRQAHLEEVLEAVDAEVRPVAHALVHRVFSGGRGQLDNQDPEWPIQQLRNNRVVHRIIFRLYFTRVKDGDLASSTTAKRAFERMHDPQALGELMRLQDPDTWPKTILLLWSMFKNEFERKHMEPALVAFWNLLSDMPGRSPSVLDEPMSIMHLFSDSLLETLVGPDGAAHSINSVFCQLQPLTSKVALITQIRAFIKEKGSLVSDVEMHEIETRLNNQILSANADELVIERHPAQVILFSAQRANPPEVPHIVHDSPKLTFALIWDCQTVSSTSEIGSRAIETKHAIHWGNMIAIHGSREMLKTRIENLDRSFCAIESWIVSELKVPSSDARHLLQLAKTTLDDESS